MRYYITLLLIAFLLVGCKTRQVQKHEEQKRVYTFSDEEHKQTLTDTSKVTVTTATGSEATKEAQAVNLFEYFRITPVDNTLPVTATDAAGNVYNITNGIIERGSGRTESTSRENAKQDSSTTASTQNNIVATLNSNKVATGITEAKTEGKSVVSEPKAWPYWWAVWLVLLLIFIGREVYYRLKNR